jgi:5-methylcytosine rRNA methyltransferase NSUN4
MEVPEVFQNYFSKVYDSRWPNLLHSLVESEKQVARWNQFSEVGRAFAQSQGNGPTENTTWWGSIERRQPLRDSEDLLDSYIMDPGSVFAARALDLEAGDVVLDMCAAPGGKTLILAEALKENGQLIANELSPGRRERLIKVIQQYIPRSHRDHIWVKGQDGVQYGLKQPGHFDKILLDAPCSGERHLLQNSEELKQWTVRRTEGLAHRQYALVASALLALKSGGELVYSTCSISPLENDGVIGKALKKKKGQWSSVKIEMKSEFAEETEWGWIFLPDRCGFGPIYVAKLRKQ